MAIVALAWRANDRASEASLHLSPPPRAALVAPLDESHPVDLNTATDADLERLPGVGPALAARIVENRAADGPFLRIDDLGRVRGIGAKTLARIRRFVTVGPREPN